DFSVAMKEMQTNWIGKSSGAEIVFPLSGSPHRGELERSPGHGYAKYKVASPNSFDHAKENRKAATEAEQILWGALRNRAIGYKFRRQHPIENYIVDFVCLNAWLIVEVDGGYHTSKEQTEADTIRDKALNELGFSVMRFTNEDVLF